MPEARILPVSLGFTLGFVFLLVVVYLRTGKLVRDLS